MSSERSSDERARWVRPRTVLNLDCAEFFWDADEERRMLGIDSGVERA